jgi:adenylate cyclase
MERRLTAILAADVVDYSRLMRADEAGTLAQLKKMRGEVIDEKIATHQGRIVKLMGDGMLAEFPSVVKAVECAAAMQGAIEKWSTDTPAERRIKFRIGINLGDIIVDGDDIYGDGVNVAARLESIATPGGIAVSQSVRDHVGNRLNLVFEDRGEQRLKNIEAPIRVYDVILEEAKQREMIARKDARPSIAVLPFNNMSGDPEQEYFSDGITEDIITDLSKISGLFVAARNTSFTYKGKPAKVRDVARDLDVAYVLEGSVRKAGARVRVTGQLVDARDGGHVWAERYDRDLTDIFVIQDEITHAIVEQLKVKLLPKEKKSIGQAPTNNVEAYSYYLKGRDLLHRLTKHNVQLARRMFARAVELDPKYARAQAGLADCDSHLRLVYHVDVPVDAILAASAKALELDANLPEAHASHAIALSAALRYDDAKSEFERALELDPQSFEAAFFYARLCFQQGKIEQAGMLYKRAAEAKPDDYQSWCLVAEIHRDFGRKQESIEAARRGLQLAEGELVRHPEESRPAQLGASALLALGENDRAREWIKRAIAIDPEDGVAQCNAACIHAQLGEIDIALDFLERSIPNVGPGYLGWIKHDPMLDPIRTHPRFHKIIEVMAARAK